MLRCALLWLCITVTTKNSYTQWVWAKHSGGTEWDKSYDIATDNFGNVYVCGTFWSPIISFGSYTLANSGADDIFLVKYDPSGTVLWATHAGGSDWDEAHSVATDKLGNVYITGFYRSPSIAFGSHALTNSGSDIFVAKYDSLGTALWARSGGGNGGGQAWGITTDISGNVCITGEFWGSPTFGSYTLVNTTGAPYDDIFVVKYSSSGNVLWAKSAGGNDYDESFGITSDTTGSIYLTGRFKSSNLKFGAYTLSASGDYDSFIAKYNSQGSVLWAKSAGGINVDEGHSMAVDRKGNIYLTGYFSSPNISFDNYLLTLSGFYDIFLVKYNSLGNVIWAKSAGGSGISLGKSLAIDATENIFLTGGFFNSSSITFGSYTLTRSSSSHDPMFIARLDQSGNVICASALDCGGGFAVGGINDCANVATDAFGNAYTSGTFSTIFPFGIGSDTFNLVGKEDIFISKYRCNVFGTNTSINNPLCYGECSGSISLTPYGAVAPYSYNWSSGQTTQTVSGLCAGNYSVMILDANNDTSATTITITQPAALMISPTAVNACIGDSTGTARGNIFGGTPAYTYNWSSGHTTSAVGNLPAGNYSLVATDSNGCADTALVVISSFPKPIAIISGADTVCSNSIVLLSASGGVNYSWSNGETAQGISVYPTSSATYSVTVIDGNNCTADTSITLTVNQTPVAVAFSSPTTITYGQTATLTANGGRNYLWMTGENDSAIFVSPTQTTIYCVVVSDSNACTDTACATVDFVDVCASVYIPNAFSPNSDDENDFLQMYSEPSVCIKSFHIIIYDRWGEKVFESYEPLFQWNGTTKTNFLNSQVLAYSLTAELINGKNLNKKGNISLIR